ncbi:MAG: DUF1501 domain-containing protein [Verrucomicrobiota bacterium]|nr:DUF1501 domain-containing protein [Verrucomicrobiota bacterium]
MNSLPTSCSCPGRIAPAFTRRGFLQQASAGFGWLAMNGLFARPAVAAPIPAPHFTPRAKNIIFCFMDGGPSQVDTFDPKPMLKKHEGKPIGAGAADKLSQASSPNRVWFPSPWEFQQREQSGLWVSELFPHVAKVADELCVVRSMVGELPLHGQQNLLLHTGRIIGQAPSFGGWVSYGLGTENQNLPGYVVLHNDWVPNGGVENFGSSFLPASYQATMMRAKGVPVDNIAPTDSAATQRRKLALLAEQGAAFAAQSSDAQAIEGAIANYETAFRMQSTVPELADISREPEHIRKLYGVDSADELQRFYATQALRARRLVEAGVRFVEITCPGWISNSPWDQHGGLQSGHGRNAIITDQSVAALITDLKARGLLDSTIVLWAGEMGRSPHTPKLGEKAGRDHHVNGYSIFMAGGGFKGGTAYGQTNEFGNAAVENPLSIHDIHATILSQMGLDHERLTYRYSGRDWRLTDVHGKVVKELLA